MSDDEPKWPGAPYSLDAKDFTVPLSAVLKELHVLEDTGEAKRWLQTPFTFQVITAGATNFGKYWSAIIGALGGAAAVKGAIEAAGYKSKHEGLAIAFTASAGVLLAATAIAVAIMVSADLRARGVASASQYAARASIASAMMASSQYGRPSPPAPASNYLVEVHGKWYPVKEFKPSAEGVVADLHGREDVVLVADVTGITTSSVWDA